MFNKKVVLFSLVAFVLAGCGGGGGGGNEPFSADINASFVYSLVDGASCSIFDVDDAGTKVTPADATGTTTDGVVNFPAVSFIGAGIIECSGGTYVDEATGTTEIGPFTRAVVNVTGDTSFTVSPLTEIATQLALADGGVLNAALANLYNALVASAFGLDGISITSTTPTDIMSLGDGETLGETSGDAYATILALVSQLGENSGDDPDTVISALVAALLANAFVFDDDTILDLTDAVYDLSENSNLSDSLNLTLLFDIANVAGLSNVEGVATITGNPRVGETLTVDVTDSNGIVGVTFAYQWAVDGVDVEGETSDTYVPVLGDVGLAVTVTATYSDNDGYAEAPSDTTSAVTNVDNSPGSVSISGNAFVDSTLTATVTDSNGFSSVSYEWFAGASPVGTDQDTYVPTLADVGETITVEATYVDDDNYSENPTSSATDPVAVPENIPGTVAISGDPIVGSTLTAAVTDDNGFSSVSYEWFAGVNPVGTDQDTYVPTLADVGETITVEATYTDSDGYDENPTSAATAAVTVPVNDPGTVAISGLAEVGETLTANVTDGNGFGSVTYAWLSNGSPVGAAQDTYSPVVGDIGNTITVTATYNDDDGYPESPTSDPTAAVIGPENDPGVITIEGTPEVGSTLMANLQDANGFSSVTYAWFSAGVSVGGASAIDYTPTEDDIGNVITVTATYTDEDGFSETPASDPTAAVAPLSEEGTVAITGDAIVGSTLTAEVTDPNGVSGATFTFSWFAGANPVGTNQNTYVPVEGDVDEVITVNVTYVDDETNNEDITSEATDAVKAANVAGSVAISGTAIVGETLTANVTDANGFSSVSYQWKAGGVDIGGATGMTFVLTGTEVGAVITVNAVYTDDDGYAEDVTSAATSAVVAANVAGTVAITGTAEVGETLTAAVTDGNGFTIVDTYAWFSDGTPVGSNQDTYMTVGGDENAIITVQATYTDDDGYAEDPTSDDFGPITNEVAVDDPGELAPIAGRLQVGSTLSVVILDDNGTSINPVSYSWRQGDETATEIGTDPTYTLTSSEVDGEVTVIVSYVDDDGFALAEDLIATTTDTIYDWYVVSGAELETAVDGSIDSDIIGLADGDYTDIPELTMDTNGVTLRRTAGSTAVIEGATCIVMAGDGILIDGLVFDNLTLATGQSCLDGGARGSIHITGDSNVVRNSQFLGDVEDRDVADFADGDEYRYVTIGGIGNTVERNQFSGKYITEASNVGSAVVILNDATPMDNESNIVQYNLFSDFLISDTEGAIADTGAHAVRIGTSSGLDAMGFGGHIVRYNHFVAIPGTNPNVSEVVMVQGTQNSIIGNTFESISGKVALVDGSDNRVRQNIFIGIAGGSQVAMLVTPNLGHEISFNYGYNVRLTFLELDFTALANTGNSSFAGDKTMTISSNTSYGAREGLEMQAAGCEPLDFTFSDNLFYHPGSTHAGDTLRSVNRDIIIDSAWDSACTVDGTSTVASNRFYGNRGGGDTGLSDNDALTSYFATKLGVDGNSYADTDSVTASVGIAVLNTIPDPEDPEGPELAAPDSDVLAEGFDGSGDAPATNDDSGFGVMISELEYLDETDVGPGTTGTFDGVIVPDP